MITKKISCTVLGCTLAAALTPHRLRRERLRFFRKHEHRHGRQLVPDGTQNAAWRTGLGILTESVRIRNVPGKIDTIAAAVLLDAEGRVADVMLDEVEISVTGDGTGKVTMPTDNRTKRQKGDDYPAGGGVLAEKGLGRAGGCLWRLFLPAKPRMR